ncbi:MAG: hypothetical protein Q9P14_18495 [candidate division KSB1 bacterium]|nr:hypothetical protein [candidate division KSB1 bacterium]
MQSNGSRQALGMLLILIGVLTMLEQFDVISIEPELVVAGIFLTAGILMFLSHAREPHVWKLFVGMMLIFISVPIFNEALDLFADEWIGAIFLWMLGLAFLVIYARDHSQWWSIIPGGILVSIGFLVAIQTLEIMDDAFLPVVLFVGFALTFLFLYLIRSPFTKTGWAIWPAVISLAIAGIITASELHLMDMDVMDYLLPIGMIVVGIYLVHRSYTQGNGDSGEIIQTQAPPRQQSGGTSEDATGQK